MSAPTTHILWFKEIDQHDKSSVGKKACELSDLLQAGFPIPEGFVITANTYFQFLRENKLAAKITAQLSTVNFDMPESIMQVSHHIQKLIYDAHISEDLLLAIDNAYRTLGAGLDHPLVVLRASATIENHPSASFANHTFFNIYGEANLILKVKEAWASLFDPRAILERHKSKVDHFKLGSVIIVQKMVQADKSGLITTVDTLTHDKDRIIIEAIYGLNDLLIDGEITPDHYEVQKSNLEVTKEVIANQEIMLTRVGQDFKHTIVTTQNGEKQKLSKNQIMDLAVLGKKLERHAYFPQDIEWAIEKDKIYIIQTTSITPSEIKKHTHGKPTERLQLLLKGIPAARGIATGMVRVIADKKDLAKIVKGEIVVTTQTDKEYLPFLKKAAALVTEKGSRLAHSAVHARSIGIPTVIGADKATQTLRTGTVITVNGSTGEIYKSGTLGQTTSTKENELPLQTATKVLLTIDEDSKKELEKIKALHADGIGILDGSMLLKQIGSHPKAFVHDNRHREFIHQLADEIVLYCQAVYPKQVIYRLSDLESHHYRNLTGGETYEPREHNPFLGFRGAARHIQEPEMLELELEAVSRVRHKKELKNLSVMIPFVRSPQELTEMKRIITAHGLHRAPTFKLWMSIDLPANVFMLEHFIGIGIDGMMIGADALTMLLLGTDKHNHQIAKTFDELNPAVLHAFESIMTTANRHHLPVSLYGQSPVLHPELLEKLVRWGIASVSVLPDDAEKVREQLAMFERKLIES